MAKNTYNKIYTKDKWEQVNPINKEILNDYVLELKSRKKSPGTISQYSSDCRAYFCYILDNHNNKSILDLKRKDFRNFILFMSENGCSNARVNRMQCSIRNLLEYITDNDEDYDYEVNVMKKIKGLEKNPVRDIVFLKEEEIQFLVDTLLDRKRTQEALFCALLYDSCSRKNELYSLKKSDLSLDSNISKSYVIGKRNKKYKPIYNDLAKKVLKIFLEERTDDFDELWTVGTGDNIKKASIETVYSWVIKWRKILSEKYDYKEFNVHSFRHSCATNLENGTHYLCKKAGRKFELPEIQKLMNHSDLSTTQSYLESKDEEELLNTFCV